tara:strand:- start:489 stop:1004 length:516 start_codon:yes stop_codon:yes gene_type:complete
VWWFSEVIYRLHRIEQRLIRLSIILVTPQPPSLLIVEETMSFLKFSVCLPPRPLSDDDWNEITSGSLVVVIAGGEAMTLPTSKAQQEGETSESRCILDDRFIGEQEQVVDLKFSYLDNAEPPNRSQHPATRSVVLRDTIPPVNPSSIGLMVTSETETPVPIEELVDDTDVN